MQEVAQPCFVSKPVLLDRAVGLLLSFGAGL